jgi:hypothetical protein
MFGIFSGPAHRSQTAAGIALHINMYRSRRANSATGGLSALWPRHETGGRHPSSPGLQKHAPVHLTKAALLGRKRRFGPWRVFFDNAATFKKKKNVFNF